MSEAEAKQQLAVAESENANAAQEYRDFRRSIHGKVKNMCENGTSDGTKGRPNSVRRWQAVGITESFHQLREVASLGKKDASHWNPVDDEEEFQVRRDKFFIEATMGSRKSLMACLQCLVNVDWDMQTKNGKVLILCYSLTASLGIKELFECNDQEQLKHSFLCTTVGLTVKEVQDLASRVIILGSGDGAAKSSAEDVTNPYSNTRNAQRFRAASIVIATPQVFMQNNILQNLPKNMFSLIIVDEGHRGMAKGTQWARPKQYFHRALVIHMTGTRRSWMSGETTLPSGRKIENFSRKVCIFRWPQEWSLLWHCAYFPDMW